ncbi:MAG: UvrD-helicase domain-containing protein [Dehalococcoidia bacterium]
MTSTTPADQDARERIHDDLDATLFVEAGAGTGKTHELIERIVRLVASGRAELRKIAAITFTESAAAELRDRVRIRLEEAARDEALSGDERARCQASLPELDAAAIETLHGFAQRILSEHPLEAGLPPMVEVQDEIRASIAFDERWAAFVDELLADPELEDVLLQAFTLGLDLKDLRAVAWDFQENWDRLEDAGVDVPPLPPIDTTMLSAQLERACRHLGRCTDQDDELYAHLVRVDAFRERLANAEDDLDRLSVLAERLDLKRSKGGNKESWLGVAPGDVRDELKAAHELRDQFLAGTRSALLPHVLAALRRFILAYAEERRTQGRLEFHDLLVRARSLLKSDPAVRRDVHERFSHLLIDEFQDTDPLQIEIATLIAGEDAGGAPLPWHDADVGAGRLFFVGDPKQSIYRFRRADIDLYTKAQARFSDGTVYLTQNFRSLQSLIDWTNDTFGHMMRDGDGQVPYVPLDASWPNKDVTVRVLGDAADENVGPIRDREAREVARTIQAAKTERWPVNVDEHGERTTRPANYADVAILMPTRTTLEQIEQGLEEFNVPYRIESRSLVYDTQEVRDLLAILRAIDDPTDEVALVSALRSPAFACGDDDLLRYYQAGGRWDYRRSKPDQLPDDDPVVAATRALLDLHHRRWWEPISGVVEAVIRERRLFELAFARRRPRERWQRYRFVLDQARAFAEAGGRTLRQFIDWAERQAQEGTRVIETVVPDPDDDAVRIMTIHAAKGLEFPIVVLAGLNVGKGRTRHQEVLWRDDNQPEARIGASHARFQTGGYEQLDDREQRMDTQEKVRLLYVGVTRARDHLVVSLHHKAKDSSHASRLLDRCGAATHLWRPVDVSQQAPLPLEDTHPVRFDDSPERYDAWIDARAQRIESLSRVHAVSATEVAKQTSASGDPNLDKDAPVEEVPPWRRGRAGTALGRAVHAVLQSIDLATGADLEGAASAQAAAEGIAGRAGDVARMVSTALQSPSVRQAVGGGRYWRELFVSAHVDGATVEGFVDLLYETPGGLVVVDYKTDIVSGDERLEEALVRYRPQGASYALALQEALGRPVERCVFLFVQPHTAQEREIADLPLAIEEVRAALRHWDWTVTGSS